MVRSTIAFASFVFLLSVACSGAAEPPEGDAEAEEAVVASDPPLAFGDLYAAHRDPRTCHSPRCGGLFVRALNHPITRCGDGTVARECYAAVADYGELGLDAKGRADFEDALVAGLAVVRATLRETAGDAVEGLPMLYVREGFRAATAAEATGTFYVVRAVARACARGAASCPTAIEVEANSGDRRALAAVDLRPSGASAHKLDLATDELARVGLVVAGRNVVLAPPGAGRRPFTLVASQYFERVTPRDDALPCAGFLGRACPEGSSCDVTIAHACRGADLPGVCKPTPPACLDVPHAVCGCDGHTYASDCLRRTAGVALDHDGPCVSAD